ITECGKTVRFTTLFHLRKLPEIEFVFADGAPIVFGVVHWKARRETTVGANDQPVLPSSASPVFALTTHKFLHLLQARNGINHLVTVALFVDEPVKEVIDQGKVLRADVRVVFMQVLEMALLHHGSFVDMKGYRDAVIMGNLDQLLHVVNVGTANIGVEKNRVAVTVLPFHEVFEIRAYVFESLGQAGLF